MSVGTINTKFPSLPSLAERLLLLVEISCLLI